MLELRNSIGVNLRQTAVTGCGWFGVSGLAKAIWAPGQIWRCRGNVHFRFD